MTLMPGVRSARVTTSRPLSPRNVMDSSSWSPRHREGPEREEVLLTELLKSATGNDHSPGDARPSPHWPGVAPGTRGTLNALSGRYTNWAGITELGVKPPVLWVHGTEDIVIADGSPWEMGTLGQMGAVSGWPGPDVFPPQPMVTQIREVLGAGGGTDADGDVRGPGPLPGARRRRTLPGGLLRVPGVGRRLGPGHLGAALTTGSEPPPPDTEGGRA